MTSREWSCAALQTPVRLKVRKAQVSSLRQENLAEVFLEFGKLFV